MAPGEGAEHGAAGGEPGRRLVSLEKLLHLSGTSSLREVGIQVLNVREPGPGLEPGPM